MTGRKHLLLLAVFIILTRWTRCQQKPQVSMLLKLSQIFCGDTFYLTCENASSGNTVKWYFNDIEDTSGEILKIAFAQLNNTGTYRCESNGVKSDDFPVEVLEYIPVASLTIQTGHPVMQTESSVILLLQNDEGLQGWRCLVYRGGKTVRRIMFNGTGKVSVDFQTTLLSNPETVFWCIDQTKQNRSNQILIRTSDKKVSLEMDPLPALTGEGLTLRCLVWGTNKIQKAVFYKDDQITSDSKSSTFNIANVSESEKGRYKCFATFTYMSNSAGPPYEVFSDDQDIPVVAPPIKAVLSNMADTHLSCSCQHCSSDAFYHWYNKNDQSWKYIFSSTDKYMKPKASGTYACRAVWKNKRSFLSNASAFSVSDASPITSIVIVLLVMIIVIVAVVGFFIMRRSRNDTEQLYEDVGLRSQDREENRYEMLHVKPGAQKEAEYDTLHSEGQGREKKEGEYEPLNKQEMKEGVYHTVKMEGAAGGEGGYEALKKEGMQEGVYHTVKMEGAAGGEGGYEALKKEGMQEGLYHTVKMEGAAGGEGGYEALKKEGMQEGLYQTLEMQQEEREDMKL